VRILTRYIWKEVLSHALLGGVLFTFVLFMKNLDQLVEMGVRNRSSISGVVEIILFTLPNTFTYTIPMAVLVGVLLGLSAWPQTTRSWLCVLRELGFGALSGRSP
jgi:lipopolysaccharide export LptBFGC system permease protein LptF